MFLARKISLPKWKPNPGFTEGEIPADTITADLRTTDNELSVWRCGDDQPTDADIRDAALAIASAMARADSIVLTWFDKGELHQAGHKIQQEDEVTNVPDLRSHHYNIQHLDYTRLGDIATRVAKAVENCQYRRFRKNQVLDLLADAVEQRRIDIESLDPKLRQEAQQTLDKRSKP